MSYHAFKADEIVGMGIPNPRAKSPVFEVVDCKYINIYPAMYADSGAPPEVFRLADEMTQDRTPVWRTVGEDDDAIDGWLRSLGIEVGQQVLMMARWLPHGRRMVPKKTSPESSILQETLG